LGGSTLTNNWKGVLIRFVKEELERIDAYCKENHVKRSDVIRNSTRLYTNNRDLVNGVIRVNDASMDVAPVLESINVLSQKVEAIEKKLDSLSVKNSPTDLMINKRIEEAVLMIKQRVKKNVITVDQLKEKLIRIDPSFAPFLYATDSSGICILDEVLHEFEKKGELRREYGGIIRLREDVKDNGKQKD
jgi:hypothetical protein